MGFVERYLGECNEILGRIDHGEVERLATHLAYLRDHGGRLFVLGVGGSAATASHAVNDFRKLCGIEAYAATDNVAELTARTNDDGWPSVFREWLKGSRLAARDAVLVLSVGGGDPNTGISSCLVEAVDYAVQKGARVFGILGRQGGYTATRADVSVMIPPVVPERVTPHTEGIASVVLHLLVSHPSLQRHATKWESIA